MACQRLFGTESPTPGKLYPAFYSLGTLVKVLVEEESLE
jgi:hypothetical protein